MLVNGKWLLVNFDKVKVVLLWWVLVVLFICYVGLMVVCVLVIEFGSFDVIVVVFID